MSETRAGIYVRISKDRAGSGLGVERQEVESRALCASRGWQAVEVFVDNDISAYSGKRRPGYERLISAVDAGTIDAVVAWHPDRLHRSPKELERFIDLVEARHTQVATVQGGDVDLSTASGRMTARVVGAVARHESEHKSERQRAKARQLALAGELGGGGTRPFGYEDDRLTVVPGEAALIADAVRRVLAGQSIRSVTVLLNGHPSPTGRGWSPSSARRMLMSARIAGLRTHRGEVVGEAVWDGIITPADHRRLRALLSDPARRSNHNPSRYLLTGLMVCSSCRVRTVARPRGDKARCYVCAPGPGFNGCGKRRALAEPLEEFVADRFLDALPTLPTVEPVVGMDDEITEVQAKLDDLASMWAEDEIDRRSWMTAQARLSERLERLQSQVVAEVRRSVPRPTGDPRVWWDGLGFDGQRAALVAAGLHVELLPAVRGRNFFDENRVEVSFRW